MLKMKKNNFRDIDLIAYDFDGVMTDNKVIVFSDGKEAVVCNRADGLGVELIRSRGIPQIIISREANRVIAARAKKIDIPFFYNIRDKKSCLIGYAREHKYDLKKTIFVGNDLNDLEVMSCVGIPMCPSDADTRVKKCAKHIFSKRGGEGVVRELADLIK